MAKTQVGVERGHDTATLSAVKRSSLILGLVALAIVGASAWLLLRSTQSLPNDPLAAVPGDAYGVVRIRLDRLLASQAWQQLVVEQGEASGIEHIDETCGFNPLEGIKQLVVFARPAPRGGTPRFAFTARGDIKHEQLIDCVGKLTGKGGSELTREDIEGITTVRSKKGASRAAFVGRDGIIGGDAESVRAAINTMLEKAPSAAKEPQLSQLYREGSDGSDIQLVARMPKELLPLLQALARPGDEQLAAIGSVKAISASANLLEDKITGGAVLLTDSPAQATAIVQLVSALRARLLDIPGIGLTGFSNTLRSIQVEANGPRATFGGTIKIATAAALLELLPALSALRDGPGDADPQPAGQPSLPQQPVAPAAQPSAAAQLGNTPVPTVEPPAPAPSAKRRSK